MVTGWRQQARYASLAVVCLLAARAALTLEATAFRLLLVATSVLLIFTNMSVRRLLPKGRRVVQHVHINAAHYQEPPFRSPDRPGQVLLAGDRHALILAELRREALDFRRC